MPDWFWPWTAEGVSAVGTMLAVIWGVFLYWKNLRDQKSLQARQVFAAKIGLPRFVEPNRKFVVEKFTYEGARDWSQLGVTHVEDLEGKVRLRTGERGLVIARLDLFNLSTSLIRNVVVHQKLPRDKTRLRMTQMIPLLAPTERRPFTCVAAASEFPVKFAETASAVEWTVWFEDARGIAWELKAGSKLRRHRPENYPGSFNAW